VYFNEGVPHWDVPNGREGGSMDKRKWLNVLLTIGIIMACVLIGCGIAKKETEANSDAVVNIKEETSKDSKEKPKENEDADAENGEQEDEDSSEKLPDTVSCIGDSVMLGAKVEMENRIPDVSVDAEESRQMTAAQDIVAAQEKAGTLGKTVVIALGTNGLFEKEDGQALIDEIGPKRSIYWVRVYGKDLGIQEDVNQQISELAQENENVTMLYWDQHSIGHDEWFYNDGIHLNGEGRIAYAEFILQELKKESE